MDIITLYASGMVTPLENLVHTKPYLILYMERFRVEDGIYTLVKLWDDYSLGFGRNVFVILPLEFTDSFSSTEITSINQQVSFCKLILMGFSGMGKPVLVFKRYMNGVEVSD